ncbi:Hypothetical protein FKW44_011153 [Caligus rogercresseyi]|uniref:Uncharacterized protein n=1 Tax=Caligus rogercresseyi TaxID=217165 RepID=A0A7T8HI03_CALRO|nr:Hypothetical protein FKW44_011153 [Caligus rogercresseyi]
MSLCCEIGCRERLPPGISVEGNPPRPSTPPSREKSASEGSQGSRDGGGLHSLSVYMSLVIN